jgi:AMP deaminase
MNNLEEDYYSFTEYRISIYGRSESEWKELADWIINNNLQVHQNRWMI